MSATPKLTAPVTRVMDLLVTSARSGEQMWGLRVCECAGLGPGTVYPVLQRLQRAGRVTSYMERAKPSGRPPRRYYEVTATGRTEYAVARTAQRARLARWVSAPGMNLDLGKGNK